MSDPIQFSEYIFTDCVTESLKLWWSFWSTFSLQCEWTIVGGALSRILIYDQTYNQMDKYMGGMGMGAQKIKAILVNISFR